MYKLAHAGAKHLVSTQSVRHWLDRLLLRLQPRPRFRGSHPGQFLDWRRRHYWS